MINTNKLLAGSLMLSGIINVSLMADIYKLDKKTNEMLNTLNRAHLIATYYVLKEDPKQNMKIEEEKVMKKNSGKLSNRTKVIGILAIVGFGASLAKDIYETKTLEADDISAAVNEIRETVEDIIDTTATNISDEI